MNDMTAFQRDLLYVIAGLETPSGQTIKDRIEEYYETEVTHGRLYPNLDALVEESYLEKGEVDRRTNYYMITEDAEELMRARREWENRNLEFAGLDWQG